MNEREDLELFIKSVESELPQEGVSKDRWKSALTARLMPKAKSTIKDLQVDSTATYDDLKEQLLETTGRTWVEAGADFTDASKPEGLLQPLFRR